MKATRVLWVGGILCLGGIILGAQFRAPAVAPAAADSATSTESQAESRLIASFTDFAGSDANAHSLVAGLRQGGEVTLTAPGSGGKAATSIQFKLPTRPMDYGNVRASLTLAREQLTQLGIRQPTPAQIKAVLAGGAVTSRSTARTTPMLLPGVLQMRAHGMDWNRIADSIGVKLGDAVDGRRSAPATALAAGAAAPGIASSAVTVTGAQGEAPKQNRAGGFPISGASASIRPGKVARVTPTVVAKPSATTGPAVAGLSQEMPNPGNGVTAARETGVTAVASAEPVPRPAIEPLALMPAIRVDLPPAVEERGPARAEPAD